MSDAGLTRDGFLGGRVQAWQPRDGYRAGNDPVLLAAACPAQAGDAVLDLGCGVGVAGLCLLARVPGVQVTGVERQPAYAALARRNAGAGLEVVEADLAALPGDLRQRQFEHVIANPPFFAPGSGPAAAEAGRAAGRQAETPWPVWAGVARARLRPGGWLTVIQRAEAVPALLAGLDGFGSVALRPLAARAGRPAGRVVLRAQKGGRGGFALLSPILVHEGEAHAADGDDYAPLLRAVLREGAALPWT